MAIQEIGFNRSNLYQIKDDDGDNGGLVNLLGATNVSLDPFGGTAIDGLALANSARLFGTNSVTNELYELSRVDGDATLIGPVAIDGPGGQPWDIVGGLAHNTTNDTTYTLARNQIPAPFTSSPNAAIPDPGSLTSTIGVPATVLGTVADLNVTLSITHPNVSQLSVSLRSPDDTTTVSLVAAGTASGANLTGTSFNDETLNTIADGTAAVYRYIPAGWRSFRFRRSGRQR